MSASHTPGPWHRGCPHPESVANAKLIAAAPDMLAALQDILHVETTAKGRGDIRWDAVHAAIAKATKS